RPSKMNLEEFLRRATDLFWARGADAVSTRDLEEALDLRAPAIYRRFKSKDELLARCIDFYVDTVIAGRIKRFLNDENDPIYSLREFFTTTLRPHKSEPGLRGCLLANTAAHAEAQVPEVRAALHRGWRSVDRGFRRQLERAQDVGRIDQQIDPESLSLALLMSMEGLLTLARTGLLDLRPGIDATFKLLEARG
ncbi:MAG: TetR/AcrR family transcriptional regulator, partial [Myxococcota bacterium]